MSEDSEETPKEVPAAKAARKRSAARKTAKPKAKPAAGTDVPAAATPVEAAASPAKRGRVPEVIESPVAEVTREGEPAPIPFFTEPASAEPPGNTKKRRRRKKKHGQPQQGQQPHAIAPSADDNSEPPEKPQAPAMYAVPRAKLDSEEVAKKAWKMFQAEVGEEGLALIDDHDAREISRRCFRLAEIFLDEAARRNR